MRCGTGQLLLCLTLLGSGPATAQSLQVGAGPPPHDSASHRESLFSPALVPAPATGPYAARMPQVGCPDCQLPKNFWRGFGELMIVQFIPWSVNRFARDAEWAKIGPESWLRNLENPWKWDNNAFLNNQFSHPYHGNLYFNAGRANGYDFWESVPWAFGGSLMWELFGEVWAPAPNDWFNTSLGGITIGESLWRLSSLTLDNTATGGERVFREIGAALLNPVRSFNRLLEGRLGDVSQNPADWRPTKLRWSLDAGYRYSSGNIGNQDNQSVDQSFFQAELDYGDSVDDLGKAPFSFMEFTVGVGSKVGDARRLQDLRIRGSLLGSTLSEDDRTVHRLGAYMTYDYYGQPAFEYGAQGFQGGLVSRFGDREGFRLHTELLGIFQPIAALKSDYFLTAEGRDYDYGMGFGARALARTTWQGLGFVEGRGTYIWTPILSGFNGNHHQLAAYLEAKTYPIGGLLGVGGSVAWYYRKSNYDALDDVSADAFQTRLFVNFSAPRWQ